VARVVVASACLALAACSDPGPRPGVDPFCSTRPQLELCEDFDGADLPGAFEQQLAEGATLTLEEEALSPPRALVVSVDGPSSTAPRAFLSRSFAFGPKLRAFAQVRLDALGLGSGEAELLAVDLGGRHLAVVAGTDGGYAAIVRGPSGTERHFVTAFLPLDEWTSLRLNVDVAEDGAVKLNAYFGETQVVTPVVALPAPEGMTGSTLQVGLVASDASQRGWRVRYDNISYTRF